MKPTKRKKIKPVLSKRELLIQLLDNYEEICKNTDFDNNREYKGNWQLIEKHNRLCDEILDIN